MDPFHPIREKGGFRMPFTPAQKQAIEAENRELLVFAAAGSGKTAVLVERILGLIQNKGLSIDRMLIVTFTRAAAGEMRERLETRLNDLAANDRRLARQADLVSTAQISTIHSYCQQVVRQNFQHCQVDPQFMLMDERSRAACYEESKEETLDWLYEAAREDEELGALARKFPERDVSLMIDSLYRFMMSRPDPFEWLERSEKETWDDERAVDGTEMAHVFCREAGVIIDGMRSLHDAARALAESPAFPPAYLNTLQSDSETIRRLKEACEEGLRPLVTATKAVRFVTLARVRPRTEDEAALAERMKSLRGRYKDMAGELQKLLPVDFEQGMEDMRRMRPAVRGLSKAVRRFHETFSGRKREDAMIDFGDLEHMALSVLRDPRLGREQAERFDAIFVDEYQDVSELQEAILNALKRPEGQSVFYVGDVKQSIYRFRLAEPRLFLSKLAAFSPEADAPQRRIVLNRNFRSRTAVLDAVNRIFSYVMNSRVTEIDYDEDTRLYAGIPSADDPMTELHVLDSNGLSSQDAVMAEATLIARDIRRVVDSPVADGEGKASPHFRDIAILLPVSKNVADKVELALSREGVPVCSDAGADPMASEEITQLLQFLSLLDNLMNDVALLSVLRGPLFDFSESELARVRLCRPEREASFLAAVQAAAGGEDAALAARCRDALDTLKRERFYLSSMPLSAYLWDFLKRSGLYVHYGTQSGGQRRQRNLRMLCHRAAEREKTHADGLSGFLRSLETDVGTEVGPAAVSPWEDAVRIMTIHKSKGLEFPTVYVMGLGRAMLGRAATRAVSVHGAIGFGLQYVNEEMRTKRTTLLQAAIALSERNAERAERARVLYVALTRPKSRLVMVGSQKGGMDALMERLNVGEQPDVYSVRGARSMLDWILACVTKEDEITSGFSTDSTRETRPETQFPTFPTSFPQKSAPWRVVFHSHIDISRSSAQAGRPMELPLPTGVPEERAFRFAPRGEGDDPLAPHTRLSHHPLKLGVTALCRAMEGLEPIEDATEEETAELKRLPQLDPKPRLLSSLPAMPAFLAPPEEERALTVGVETHRVLGLLPLEGVRDRVDDTGALISYIKDKIRSYVLRGVMDARAATLADEGMIARFFQSGLGRRMLASPETRREWSFNLLLTEPFEAILQGVIDLCFLEDGAWVLVDFKTDRVKSADELWARYARQLDYYRLALERGTPWPVKERTLYSLRLGEGATKYD